MHRQAIYPNRNNFVKNLGLHFRKK